MKATRIPDGPFTTEDFSLRGGGIDFLGLRWVGLTIVGRSLIPELNNVTTDMGMFLLGAWIPWKFRALCIDHSDYTEGEYKSFREKVEVAISLTMNDDLGVDRPNGHARNRVGITQKCELPGSFSFKTVKRNERNSLYAAAIYGPSIHALGLIQSYRSLTSQGKRSVNIPVPPQDEDTLDILQRIDNSLRRSGHYTQLASLKSSVFDAKGIRSLAESGLDPASFRGRPYGAIKAAFRRRLLPTNPQDPGFPRTLTARLIVSTLHRRDKQTQEAMRDAWFTRMFEDGARLQFKDEAMAAHGRRWALFMARQYQRYSIELFLWCFEDAIGHGCRSIDDVIEHWMSRTKESKSSLPDNFEEATRDVAGPFLKNDAIETSKAWNAHVHGGHERFEYCPDPQTNEAVMLGIKMMAGWYWRMLVYESDPDTETRDLMALGGSDRMSMAWFLRWLRDRRRLPIRDLLKEIFSNLVFAQHIRIALARFDGSAQRVRFLVGDAGIEPTISARKDIGQLRLPWMPDRLHTLIALLCDCDVLEEDQGTTMLGPASDRF